VEQFDAKEQFGRDRRRLLLVLTITGLYFLAELVGGFYANSLALLTDAVHMLTDIAALCLSLFTLWIASRPATPDKTYGYLRAEILGALFNGLFLWVLVAFIWFEAANRLHNPPQVRADIMMLVAGAGIVINGTLAWLANERTAHTSLARRAVFVHVLSDMAGSGGVLAAGVVASLTGWHRADPMVSFLIGGLIIYGSWGLIREGVDILMESTPAHININDVRSDLLAVSGTEEIHDLHVWCLASHQFALSAHAVVTPEANHDKILSDIAEVIERKFNIRHMTVQLERDNRKQQEYSHH
jgi:cobalt-zinc-cadmium efflux system protein